MISYEIGATRGRRDAEPFPYDDRDLLGNISHYVCDFSGGHHSRVSPEVFKWLDANAPYYHVEAVAEVVQAKDRLYHADCLCVLHVYEPNTAFELRLRFNVLPMTDGWRERFARDGFNSLYPGLGLSCPEHVARMQEIADGRRARR